VRLQQRMGCTRPPRRKCSISLLIEVPTSANRNVHLQAPTLGQLTSMHFYGWKKGLKTGMYYLRTRPAAQAIQFTVDQSVIKDAKTANTKAASAVVEKKNKASRGGVISPLPSPSPSPVRIPARASVPVTIKQEPITPSLTPPPTSSGLVSPPPSAASLEQATASLSLDNKTKSAAEADPEFAAAEAERSGTGGGADTSLD